ncbi:hypothetical protein OAN94_04690 [Verrucomicrobiales bacterium]|nr:hypothetical protein [Verrucomicrobiales bacterium]
MRGPALAISLLWLISQARAAAEVSVQWVGESVEARGVSLSSSTLDWETVFTVHLDSVELEQALIMPPMAGSYTLLDGILTFQPRFPLQAGQRYRASLRVGDEEPLVALNEVPREKTVSTTTVDTVYPTADNVPENLLKFYLHFSAPMSRGHIYDYIHLMDDMGQEIELPFLELDEELWDREMKRVTLFIDPGRIKRKVKPLEEIGPSLIEGKTFKLVIDAAWEDADGLPLAEGYVKAFRVGAGDRSVPNPKLWTPVLPDVGSMGKLQLRFPEPMDHALSVRLIRLENAKGVTVEGAVSMAAAEQVWEFKPEIVWKAGDYRFRVLSTLEDLAGNQIGKPFEVDLFEEIDDQGKPKTHWVNLPFTIPAS